MSKALIPIFHLSYVSTELREISQEDLNTFLDDFNHYVFEMISSSDTNSKMGGILAIVVLINADVCNTGTRISRSQRKQMEKAGASCILGYNWISEATD